MSRDIVKLSSLRGAIGDVAVQQNDNPGSPRQRLRLARDDAKLVAMILLGLLVLLLPTSSFAGESMPMIRDAEIEEVIEELAAPVIVAAGFDPKQMRIYIIADPSLNAFTGGGMQLFLHTGLITACDDPEMLLAVIAHELGHIAGGHIARQSMQMRQGHSEMIVGALLGAGAALMGAPELGMATALGAMHIGQRQALRYSRQHEHMADQAGINYLHKTGHSAEGMLKLMQQLAQATQGLNLDPYTLTHPPTGERIAHARSMLKADVATQPYSSAFKSRYARAVVKLRTFTAPIAQKLGANPDTTLKLYAESIDAYRHHHKDKAIAALDLMLAKTPLDPYLLEFKGQILFEYGDINAAKTCYAKAVALKPKQPLLQWQYGVVLLTMAEKGDHNALNQAIQHFQKAHALDPRDANILYRLGRAYGMQGKIVLSYEYLSRYALAIGDSNQAKRYAREAEHYAKAHHEQLPATLQDQLRPEK